MKGGKSSPLQRLLSTLYLTLKELLQVVVRDYSICQASYKVICLLTFHKFSERRDFKLQLGNEI